MAAPQLTLLWTHAGMQVHQVRHIGPSAVKTFTDLEKLRTAIPATSRHLNPITTVGSPIFPAGASQML